MKTLQLLLIMLPFSFFSQSDQTLVDVLKNHKCRLINIERGDTLNNLALKARDSIIFEFHSVKNKKTLLILNFEVDYFLNEGGETSNVLYPENKLIGALSFNKNSGKLFIGYDSRFRPMFYKKHKFIEERDNLYRVFLWSTEVYDVGIQSDIIILYLSDKTVLKFQILG